MIVPTSRCHLERGGAVNDDVGSPRRLFTNARSSPRKVTGVEFDPNETMGVLRERAVKSFGNVPTPHLLSLHTIAGVEFGPDRDQQTIRDAGIKKNDELLLRPGVVRGG